MTQKRGRGRPKGSGRGLSVRAMTALTPDLTEAIDAAALSLGIDRSAMIRRILERWEARKLKRARRKLVALLKARARSIDP
jgi:Ribbon-helix-helix protein, copG family